MKTYVIEMMDNQSYAIYMGGGFNYDVEKVTVPANSAEEAIEKARCDHPEMIINTSYVRTVEELAEEKARIAAEADARHQKEEAKKARRLANEKAKAEAAGMTVEEYRAEQRRKRKIRETEREIAQMEENLANLKKYLEKLKNGT